MRYLLVLVLLAAALGGCTESTPDSTQVTVLPDVELAGVVQTANFNPIEGATVTVTGPSVVYSDGSMTEDVATYTATTNSAGNFTIQGPPGNHALSIEAEGFRAISSTVILPQANVTYRLEPVNVDIPYHESFDFDGTIECAVEALIITPSCDTLLKEYNEAGAVFQDDSIFELTTQRGWQTVVLDVRFDGSQYPGVAGLRASAYSADADAEVFSYERIHQEWAGRDFSLRIDAGEDYGDAVTAPDSSGGDGIRFEFYPQGHGDDTLCIPEESPELHPSAGPGRCFLGVGSAQDLTFTAKATIFVHEPAPQGWTTLAMA